MNRLSELQIEGYKSIECASIPFTNINILIGENGAGKSNLLAFLDMLQRIRESELQNYVMEQGGINALLYNGRKHTKECYFCIKRDRYQFCGRIKAGNADSCYLTQQSVYDYNEQGTCYAAEGFPELKNPEIVKQTKVLDGIATYHFHDTSNSSPMKASCNIHDNIELARDGRNIAAILYLMKAISPEIYEYIIHLVRLVAPYFKEFVLRTNPFNQQTIRLEWKKEGCEIPFGADQLSDGTLRFICLATLLCLPEDILVVENKEGKSSFQRLDAENLMDWLEEYSLGELWKKNLIGGRP